MLNDKHLDAAVRERLRGWPQHPPGMRVRRRAPDAWLRGRPGDIAGAAHPFLKYPGQARLRTLPDGLWLNFGGTVAEPFADIFAVEACSTVANLLDKRSRFAASTQALLAVCPVAWLLAPAGADGPTPRWRVTRILAEPPRDPLVLPVRDIRVLYGLKPRHYQEFAIDAAPLPHEYFAPVDALLHPSPTEELRAMLASASAEANLLPAEPARGFSRSRSPASARLRAW